MIFDLVSVASFIHFMRKVYKHTWQSLSDPKDDEVVYEYAYDKNGRLISEKEYKDNNIIFECRYEYN